MKNVSSMMKRVSLIFLTAIMIIGNIVLSPHIALGAVKKSVATSDEKEVLHKSNDERINDEYSNDELFEGYLNKLFYNSLHGSSNFGNSNLSQLNEIEKKLYLKLKEIITEIANGEKESTYIVVDELEGYQFVDIYNSKANTVNEAVNEVRDLVDNMIKDLNTNKVVDMLIADCPYELYWYNKEKPSESRGISFNYLDNSPGNIIIQYKVTLSFKFKVADDYSKKLGDGTYDEYYLDSNKIRLAQFAKANADSIIDKYESLNDYDKLYAYLEEICKLVTYDTYAWEHHRELTIINPWQLVSVFDGNYNTNVVCEGYSKAFAYLCERSHFQNNIKCYIVSGNRHMWNIVTMEDGKNYIVDVTNCDEGMVGNPDLLFLSGAEGDVDNGYTFTRKSNGQKLKYMYYDTTKQLYPQSILEISDTDYRPKEEPPTISPKPETPNKPSSSINTDKKITSGNANYKVISTNGVISVQFAGVKKKLNNVVIPATVKINNKNYKVTEIAKNAMKNDKAIKKLTIGKNITTIGNNAFSGCKNLKNIVIRTKKLTSKKIGKNAFKGIKSNATVTVPDGMMNKYKNVLDKIL